MIDTDKFIFRGLHTFCTSDSIGLTGQKCGAWDIRVELTVDMDEWVRTIATIATDKLRRIM